MGAQRGVETMLFEPVHGGCPRQLYGIAKARFPYPHTIHNDD
jgi:hypothetical protein